VYIFFTIFTCLPPLANAAWARTPTQPSLCLCLELGATRLCLPCLYYCYATDVEVSEVSDWFAVQQAIPVVIWVHCLLVAVTLKISWYLYLVNTSARWSSH